LGGISINYCEFKDGSGYSSGGILIDRSRGHTSLNITNSEFSGNKFFGILNKNKTFAFGYASDIATIDKNAAFENDGSYKKKLNLMPDVKF
jgi:hypothetical protein